MHYFMCIKVMCREYTLFDNNSRPKKTENLSYYIKQDVYAYSQAFGGLSLRYNTIFEGERISLWLLYTDGTRICAKHLIYGSFHIRLTVDVADLNEIIFFGSLSTINRHVFF